MSAKGLQSDEEISLGPKLEVSDPLSEVSRRERRGLLGLSLASVAIVYANLIPSQISAVGLTIDEINESALLLVLSLAVAYFLVAFVIYAYSDFVGWRLRLSEAEIAATRRREEFEEWFVRTGGPEDNDSKELSSAYSRLTLWWAAARPASIVRAVLEFGIPVAFGLFSLGSLLWFAV